MPPRNIVETVQLQYASVAQSDLTNDVAAVQSVAKAFGYSEQELATLPPQANMGLSCGNPVAVAALVPGEVVVDLGCGGGLDVFLAADRVGPAGRAIGIDMTPEMIDRARAGALRIGAANTEFFLSKIDTLPLEDDSVDCIISNCVINLAPDKSKVFREMLRVLKPGGRVSISDIALKQTLPPAVAASLQAYVGCIAGAIQIADYRQKLSDAGFQGVVVSDTGSDLNAYSQVSGRWCCSNSESTSESSELHDGLTEVLATFDANAFAASVRIHAIKPKPTDVGN